MAEPNAFPDYAGDLSVKDGWALLENEPGAQLVDVRTTAEWAFVGLPDLSSLRRAAHCTEWQVFPGMAVNPDFTARVAAQLRAAGATDDTAVLFLCRSGARSRAAAIALTEAGFRRAYNLAGGFEGDVDSEGHRSRRNGWKAAGLPWRQT
ncbi:MAG TPA: rhodanese-like domain-containing protein [Rhizomicrobium sp.]|jgi:rhodanese-related sulfurtransferase